MEGTTDSLDETIMEIWDPGTIKDTKVLQMVTENDVKVKNSEPSTKLFDVYGQEASKQWAIFNSEKGHCLLCVMPFSQL